MAITWRRTGTASSVALASMTLAGFTYAQTATPDDGGLRFQLDSETRVSAGENLADDPQSDDASVILSQGLNFGIESQTRTQSFEFGISGTFGCSDASGCYGLSESGARLSYQREGVRSNLRLSATYTDRALHFGDILLDPNDILVPDALVSDTGSLQRLNYALAFETGIDTPLGLALSLTRDERRYVDTISPSLFDRSTDAFGADARFTISPVMDLHLTAGLLRYQADDVAETLRDRYRLGVGGDFRIDARTDLSAEIAFNQIENTTGIGVARATTTDQGPTLQVDLTRVVSDGAYSMSLTTSAGDPFSRDTLTFGRNLTLPTGELVLRLGVSETSDDIAPIGSLNWRQDLPRGNLTLNFSHINSVTDENSEVAQTRFNVSHGYQLNANHRLDLAFDLAQVDDLSPGGDKTRRAGLSATLNRELTPEWGVAFGYRYDWADTNGGASETSNSVSISLQRSISWRK